MTRLLFVRPDLAAGGGWKCCKNAFDHTDKGAEIRIEWCEFASIVQIVVRDNGKGIHPEDLPHIFKTVLPEPFSKDTQGIGLAPLAKAITEAHSGTIEVDSELGAGKPLP